MPTPPRILIIEDEPVSRRTTSRLLEVEGFEVRAEGTGEEGLSALRQDPPDAVVCDILMPGLDGFGVLEAAQADPRLCRVPFLFLTSLVDHDVRRRCMACGADDYLTKPLRPGELVEALRARLKKAAAQDPGWRRRESIRARIQETLSDREEEVLRLLGKGLLTKEIAAELEISPRTVDIHRSNILRKLGLGNAAAAAHLAAEAGLY